MFADWTDRISKGEVPPAPPRPQGPERNLVLTQWDWGGQHSYIHDEVAADKRNPTIGARGKVYGVDFTGDSLLWVDPVEHTSGQHSDSGAHAGRAVVHPREDRERRRRTGATRRSSTTRSIRTTR